MPPAPTIESLLDELMAGKPAVSPEYAAKMLHPVPDMPVVKREAFIVDACTGKRVLEFGASGPMHEAIVKAASVCVGVDRDDAPGVIGFDLDDVALELPDSVMNEEGHAGPDVIVCGEVLEHLSNPGWFLTRLKRQYHCVPVIISVPNALSEVSQKWIRKGTENVNGEHVAWYSWKTLTTLLSRHGYTVRESAWYNGQPRTAEGLIVVVE